MLVFFIFLFATLFSEEVEIYFTTPYYSVTEKSIDNVLKEHLDSVSAGSTVYIAAYQLEDSKIVDSFLRLSTKRCRVYGVFDANVSTKPFILNFPFKIVKEKQMHNKFIVVRDSSVWTGSYNFTVNATNYQNNFAVKIYSQELAQIYEKAFLEIWNNKDNFYNINSTFVQLKNVEIAAYFNPDKSLTLKEIIKKILWNEELSQPRVKKIDLAVSYLTSLEIIDLLKILAKNFVKVNCILDDVDENFYAYNLLKNASVNLDFDKEYSFYGKGVMHHKFCVLTTPNSEKFVICGSANWSENGLSGDGNYENILVIKSKNVAESFLEEFNRIKYRSSGFNINPPILITEVIPDSSNNKIWMELFVVDDGEYGGWKIISHYPKATLAVLPYRFYKSGEIIVVNLGYTEDCKLENVVVIDSTNNVTLYNTEGFISLKDKFDRYIDVCGWSNRDGSISSAAKQCLYELINNNMWSFNLENNDLSDIELQSLLVCWTDGSSSKTGSLQRKRDVNGLPLDSNSNSDWIYSKYTTKGYGYRNVVSLTESLLEVDKNTNPFSPEDPKNSFAKINFNIPELEVIISLVIYDISGNIVTKLLDRQTVNPQSSITWDGRDKSGNFVNTGLYIVFLEAYNITNAKKYVSKDIVVVYRK